MLGSRQLAIGVSSVVAFAAALLGGSQAKAEHVYRSCGGGDVYVTHERAYPTTVVYTEPVRHYRRSYVRHYRRPHRYYYSGHHRHLRPFFRSFGHHSRPRHGGHGLSFQSGRRHHRGHGFSFREQRGHGGGFSFRRHH